MGGAGGGGTVEDSVNSAAVTVAKLLSQVRLILPLFLGQCSALSHMFADPFGLIDRWNRILWSCVV